MTTIVKAEQTMSTTRITNKLHYQRTATQHEGLGLIVICEIAVEEMKTIALHKVILSTRRSENDGSELVEP